MQGEMQQLRDKLAIAERTATSEAQLKEKYQLRLKVLEEGLRMSSSGFTRSNIDRKSVISDPSRCQSLGGAENISKSLSNGFVSRRSPSFQLRSSLSNISTTLKNVRSTSKSFDGGSRSLDRGKILTNGTSLQMELETIMKATLVWQIQMRNQKEVINLRKTCHEKDQSLKDKDDAIEGLSGFGKERPHGLHEFGCLPPLPNNLLRLLDELA
ncbi:microtubule-associated protein 70-2-like isoform X1 [Canna indica]|uniref:Microtubule-associated protein 70-2-like isoform X1 n=1 Tax=Canna indica TaxID=4628 RepID=A0AAQ3QDJ0_9LILI|nr:microtubule-associated protein 70-2-like isoform X1 [Canna indica]